MLNHGLPLEEMSSAWDEVVGRRNQATRDVGRQILGQEWVDKYIPPGFIPEDSIPNIGQQLMQADPTAAEKIFARETELRLDAHKSTRKPGDTSIQPLIEGVQIAMGGVSKTVGAIARSFRLHP